MSDKAKKILGIILALVLALCFLAGLTGAFCLCFEWWVAILVTLGLTFVSFGFGGLIVLAVNLINR